MFYNMVDKCVMNQWQQFSIFCQQAAEAATGGVLEKTLFLKLSQNSLEKTPVPESLFKKETLAQVFSCELWENFKNTFFEEHRQATAFEAVHVEKYIVTIKTTNQVR